MDTAFSQATSQKTGNPIPTVCALHSSGVHSFLSKSAPSMWHILHPFARRIQIYLKNVASLQNTVSDVNFMRNIAVFTVINLFSVQKNISIGINTFKAKDGLFRFTVILKRFPINVIARFIIRYFIRIITPKNILLQFFRESMMRKCSK